jgi:hypothetical protein
MRGKSTTTVQIESWVRTLTDLLKRGIELKPACLKAKIPYTTFLDQMDKYDWVRTEIEAATNFLDNTALQVWADEIVKKKNYDAAKDWLKSSQRDRFSTSTNVDLTTKGESLNKVVYLPPIDGEPIETTNPSNLEA